MYLSIKNKDKSINLKKSALIGQTVFYAIQNRVYSRKLPEFNTETEVRYDNKYPISSLINLNGNLVIQKGNQIETVYVAKDSLVIIESQLMADCPITHRATKDKIVFLIPENKIIIKSEKQLKRIKIVETEEIVDFSVQDEEIYFLGKGGNVYFGCVEIEQPEIKPKIMEKLGVSSEIFNKKIVVMGNKIYVANEFNFCELEKFGNFLQPKYFFRSEVGVELFKNNNRMFCAGESFMQIDNVPKFICDGDFESFLGDCAVFKDKIVFLGEDRKQLMSETNIPFLIKEELVEEKVEDLLFDLVNFRFGSYSEETVEEELLKLYNNVYAELKSYETGFDAKIQHINNKFKKLTLNVQQVDEKKEQIAIKQKQLIEYVESIWNKIGTDESLKEIKKRIENTKKKIEELDNLTAENLELLKALKAQRLLLCGKLIEENKSD